MHPTLAPPRTVAARSIVDTASRARDERSACAVLAAGDGAAHTSVAAWWADMHRQNGAWISGERVLRFPAVALRHEPELVVGQLRVALVAGGWPGPRSSCESVSP